MKVAVKVKRPCKEISVSTEYIKLDSFLKIIDSVGSGGEAKLRIQNGEVKVNGEVCTMRGKKLYNGDEVEIEGKAFCIKKNDS